MNKRLLIPISFLLASALLSGCAFQIVTGSGKTASETRNVSGFTSVTLAGIGNLYITQGATESVRIEAEDNLIPYFDTSVVGSTLRIGIKAQYTGTDIHPTLPVKFYVTLPKIDAVTLSGSGNILATTLQTQAFTASLTGSGDISIDSLNSTTLDLNLSGSGNIKLGTVSATTLNANIAGSGNIQADTLTASSTTTKTAGSGNITFSGKVTGQSAEIIGSGDYQAQGLKSDSATVKIAGSGSAVVAVADTLNVSILGSGNVTYSGSPKTSVNIAGSGKVLQAAK